MAAELGALLPGTKHPVGAAREIWLLRKQRGKKQQASQ